MILIEHNLDVIKMGNWEMDLADIKLDRQAGTLAQRRLPHRFA